MLVHLRKDPSSDEDASLSWLKELLNDALHLETCLRGIWITQRSPILEQLLAAPGNVRSLEVLTGSDAYQFMLQVACGLESAIPGETDVFGQVKEACKKFEDRAELAGKVSELRPWIQRWFEDVKEIRSRYLQGFGGSSYGTLTRLLLKNDSSNGPVLLIGAGQMARSILPYLTDREVWVWNRSRDRVERLIQKQQEVGCAPFRILETTTEAEKQAWLTAKDVIVCIPGDSKSDLQRDFERVAWWQSRSSTEGTLLHLGLLDPSGTPWFGVSRMKTLQHLFGIQKQQNEARMSQLQHAHRACLEKAQLRALGGSSTLAHGWEDLAIFAT